MAAKGCGTCRARKVRCDRTLPVCNRCLAIGKECTGYGMRLSWPRPGNQKRSIQGPPPTRHGLDYNRSQLQLVNISSWDMEMQDYISMHGIDHNLSLDQRGGRAYWDDAARGPAVPAPLLSPSIAFALIHLTVQERDLYQYFVSVASFSLAAFGQNTLDIRDAILRMAISDSSDSSNAVLRSAIAFSSLHRYGPQANADRFKISALQALSAGTQGVIDKPRSFQHVAAGMLLGSFETQQRSETSSHWLWYICGSKSIIKTTRLDDTTGETDFAALISWVQYYDILARFSLRHWKRNHTGEDVQIQGLGISGVNPTVCSDTQQGGRLKNFSHDVLSLLSEVCDTVMEKSDETSQTEDYQNYLKVLEWKIRQIQTVDATINRDSDPKVWETANVLELYRLATLIYLLRSSGDPSRQPAKLFEWVNSAFAILAQLETCRSPFPLLILGCEADSDERRIVMLDLIARTEEQMSTRSLDSVVAITQALWAHQDLSDEELDYSQKLHIIFSSSEVVPVLV